MNKMFADRERLGPVIPISGHAGPGLRLPCFSVGDSFPGRGSRSPKYVLFRKNQVLIAKKRPFYSNVPT
jgi:hypothetical protein